MATLIDLTGQKIDKLLVLEKAPAHNRHVWWKCQCDCGNICEKSGEYLRSAARPRDCGCSKLKNIKKKKAEERYNKLVGQKFGRLLVISRLDKTIGDKKTPIWLCKCDCGNYKEVPSYSLLNGHTQSCGCLVIDNKWIDITGKTFGKLTAIERDPTNHKKWICKCECDNIKSVDGYGLRNGITQSCGCINYSIGEQNIKNILDENKIKYIKEYCNSELQLKRFDFALIDNNEKVIRFIEFDGEQHYKSNRGTWDKEDSLELRQKRDKEKNQYALSHNIPLVRIPYWERDNITLEMLFSDEYLVKEEDE